MYAKLTETKICLNCDLIYSTDEGLRCPLCGSSQYEFISRWIKPLEEPKPTPVVTGIELFGRMHWRGVPGKESV